MKVLRILNELRPSGVEATLRATASLWAAHGVEIDILAIGPQVGPYASTLEDAGYRVYHLPLEPPRRFFPKYAHFLLRQDYDVVHVHTEKANVHLAGFARLLATTAVVRSVHNVYAFKGLLRARRYVQRALLRGLGVTHVSIGPSVEAAERNYYRNRTQRIYNSYEDQRFVPPSPEAREGARQRMGAAKEDFVIITVGNCSTVKNHVAVLRAVDRLKERLSVRYVHVGLEQPGQPERSLARELELQARTVFLGQVDDVASVLHAGDCFVMPSQYEGLGNAALEALGCGMPCVLADVPGLRDLGPFFATVWWTKPEPSSIAEAIADVAALSNDSRIRLRTDLAATARRYFSSSVAVGNYLQLYCRLLEQRPVSRYGPLPRRVMRLLADR